MKKKYNSKKKKEQIKALFELYDKVYEKSGNTYESLQKNISN